MTDFILDTSGIVAHWHDNKLGVKVGPTYWSDLDAFTQGYGEAAARELYGLLIARGWTPEAASAAVAFRNWSSEALAMILADCAAMLATGQAVNAHDAGGLFWRARNQGAWVNAQKAKGYLTAVPAFPPQVVAKGDDGKVKLEVAK